MIAKFVSYKHNSICRLQHNHKLCEVGLMSNTKISVVRPNRLQPQVVTQAEDKCRPNICIIFIYDRSVLILLNKTHTIYARMLLKKKEKSVF